jgi:hypothetical protein
MTRNNENDANNLDDRSGEPDLDHAGRQLPVLANFSEGDKDSVRDKKLRSEDNQNPEGIPPSEVVFLLSKDPLEGEFLRTFPLWEMTQMLGQSRSSGRTTLNAIDHFTEGFRGALRAWIGGFFAFAGSLVARHLRLLQGRFHESQIFQSKLHGLPGHLEVQGHFEIIHS